MTQDLQQFIFQGEIGRGAMAIVWRGWDSRLERVVAVKEPLIPVGTDPQRAAEMASRFVIEGKVAARISHPGLVTIYDADIWDGRAAIIMEYVEGETLSNVIDRSPLPVPSALVVAEQLLAAVAYAHAAGIIHRDIKPDNVFVTPEGRIKLSDFGVARVSGGKRLTQAGTIVGTPGYMAPEQILGAEVDARCDLFSIGVVTYEMLVGGNPFGATDGLPPTDIMRRIVHEEPPALAGRLQGVSPQLQAALDRSLAKSPADRFNSAEEMLGAFQASAGNGAGAAGHSAFAARTPAQPDPIVIDGDPQAPPAGDPWANSDLRQAAGLDTTMGADGQGYWLIGGGVAVLLLALVLFAVGAAIIALGVIVAAVVVLLVFTMRRGSERELAAIAASDPFASGRLGGVVSDFGSGAAVGCVIAGPGDSRTMRVVLPARIGRAVDAEVSVMDEQASRYHARLVSRAGGVWVEDLGSRNGTYLDGLPIHGETPVRDGQRLSVGLTTIDFIEEAY